MKREVAGRPPGNSRGPVRFWDGRRVHTRREKL